MKMPKKADAAEGVEMLNPLTKKAEKSISFDPSTVSHDPSTEQKDFVKIPISNPSRSKPTQAFLRSQKSALYMRGSTMDWKFTKVAKTNSLTLFILGQVIFMLFSGLVLLPVNLEDVLHHHNLPGWFAMMNWKDMMLCPLEEAHKVGEEYTAILCSEGSLQVSMVAVARLAAYFMYLSLFFVYITKAHALRTWLSHSCLSMYIPFYDWHTLHVYCGQCITVCTVIHVACWLVNFSDRMPDTKRLMTGKIGLTGSVATIVLPFIVCMMAFQKLRKKYSWEFRKGVIHVWFSYLFAIMLYFHCKNGSWVLIAFCIYLADVIFVAAFRTYKVEHSKFQIIGKCVKLQFKNPPTFDVDHLGYVNICVPWLEKSQWHAFSCYPSPTHPDHTELCMQVSGDWTTKLFKSLSARQSVRPVWIQGPFASPYEKSVERDNLIMVASGIGITPALSCLSALGGSRRTNLIWICRDPSLIEFFIPVVTWPESGWALIYYTGKSPLELPSDFQMPGSVKIIRGRPQLNFLIPELINSIETEDALPEDLIKTHKENSDNFKMSIDDIDIAQPPVDRLRLVISRLIGTFMTAQEFYTQFDTDGDHSLGASELIRGLSSFSRRLFVLSQEETSELMDIIANRTEADQITETEFKAFVDESLYCEEDEVDRKSRMQSQASTRAPKRDSALSHGWKVSSTNKRTELTNVFKEFDEDGDGTISIDELITAMGKCGKTITKQQAQVAMVNSFKGSDRKVTMKFDEGINFDQFFTLFKDIDIEADTGIVDFFSDVKLPKSVTDRWAMLYCGGAAPVIAALDSCSEALGVKFKSESFSW